ncbi:MAG: hypothetical protein M0R05_05705 [Bacilli bacterium]|nr:hypothetical protein [Bacilli bacterium]MDD4388688.1 hypothetical protein [Bacilli bacterium]
MDKEKIDNKKTNNEEQQLEKDQEKKSNQTPDIPQRELQKMLKQLQEQYNLDSEKVKVVQIKRRKVTVKEIILSVVFGYLLDLFLTMALNGYLAFADYDFLSIILFSLIFTTIETVLKQFFIKYIFRLVLMSFGMITIPLTIISFVIAVLVTPGLTILHTGRMILFFIIFMIIRLAIRMFIMRKNILKQRGNKND